MPEAVDEHFGRAVDAITKGVETADRVNQLSVARLDAGILDQAAILRILLVAQLERMNDGIAETADAELQRAVVADQRARVQADRIVGRSERHFRCGEKRRCVERMVPHAIEAVGSDFGHVPKQRQVWMYLTNTDR